MQRIMEASPRPRAGAVELGLMAALLAVCIATAVEASSGMLSGMYQNEHAAIASPSHDG